MKNPETLAALLKIGELEGLVRFRENPTERDMRSHFLHMSLYATAFLFPFFAS